MRTALIDLAGQRFGAWTVLERAPNRGPQTMWLARCDCGSEYPVGGQHLRCGKSLRCRECKNPWYAGQIVGTRTLIERGKRGVWVSRCNLCGKRVLGSPLGLVGAGCQRCSLREDTHGRMFTVAGETHNLAGWARRLGISREAVRIRLKRGMSPEAACTMPRTYKAGRRAA